jgi:predicted MFS family arabinose efflux permease
MRSLRDSREFRFLWSSNLFFFGGAWAQTTIMSWMLYAASGSELLIAVFAAARLAPLILGPFAGVVADRHNRVRLLQFASWWALAAGCVASAVASITSAPAWLLVAAGFAIGLAQSPSQPARSSLVIEIVGPENLHNATALNAVAMNVTQIIGAAAGGALIAAVGAPAALWVTSGAYVGAIACLRPLHRHGAARVFSPEPVLAMLVDGLRRVAADRSASAVLGVTFAANILLWPIFQAFMPVFADHGLELGPRGLGGLLACAGGGGLIGSVLISGFGATRRPGALFIGATTIWALAWSGFALIAQPAAAFAVMAVIGLTGAGFAVLQTTLLLQSTEPVLHGRALGFQELAIGIMPISALLLGAVAHVAGVQATTWFCGVMMAVVTVVVGARTPELLRVGGPQSGTPSREAPGKRPPTNSSPLA